MPELTPPPPDVLLDQRDDRVPETGRVRIAQPVRPVRPGKQTLEEAQDLNRRLHRRVQATEGELLSKISFLEERLKWQTDHLRQMYDVKRERWTDDGLREQAITIHWIWHVVAVGVLAAVLFAR
jgi:hypothetical protein